MPIPEPVYARVMKWEYKTLCLSIGRLIAPNVDTAKVDTELTKWGRDGWELVSVFDTNAGGGASYQLVAIFKRPGSTA